MSHFRTPTEPAPFPGLVWGLNTQGQWESMLRGFPVLVTPPAPGLPLRNYAANDYGRLDSPIAQVFADTGERIAGCSPSIAIHVGPANPFPFHAWIPASCFRTDAGELAHFEVFLEGAGAPLWAPPHVRLLTLLEATLQRHATIRYPDSTDRGEGGGRLRP